MAENISINTQGIAEPSRELCRYYMHGACRFGENCFYSHEKTTKPINIVCRYYLAGECSFGDHCFYEHVRPKSQSTSSSLLLTEEKNSNNNNLSENNSASTSPSTNSTISNNENNLVQINFNKPILKTSISDDSSDNSAGTSNSLNDKSPNSYVRAVTCKNDQEFLYQDLENVDPYDENYVKYLNMKKNESEVNKQLCPYYEKCLSCPYESSCDFIHGNTCEICNMACLNPFDEIQCEQHRVDCMNVMEKEMEEAFAVQRSSDKPCGICMEVVWEKENVTAGDKRFGILENCNHVFCLPCIRKWRSSKSYENKVCKACPECRVKSDFVTPNKFWPEDESDKKQIIQDYKLKLGQTQCKYFKQGDGECPFGSKCFYLHRNKDGTLAELPEPKKRHRLNRDEFSESYSNVVTVDFDFSDDEDDDFDILEFFRHSLLWEHETSESEFSELFEFSDEFLS